MSQITFRSSSTMQMTTSRQFDYLNRLLAVSNTPAGSGALPASFNYAYKSANQRTTVTQADQSWWAYQYDALGQVTSGKKYWRDGSIVAGQQFEYSFDTIGNRTQTQAGGDENGANLRVAFYTNNSLNQLTSRGVPGAVDVLGLALATNTVTVNGQPPYRKVEYFRKELAVNNSSAVWTNITVSAVGETSVNGNAFVAKTPETFGYDADGNLTSDGRWVFSWDAENRLTQVESRSDAPSLSKRKVVWEYDAGGRRIRQTTSDGSSGSYVVTEDLKFVSDGWRHLAELNATNNAPIRSYAWGLDLSGSMAGAGGVGGLLMLNSAANGTHFYGYDGNGNVAILVKGTDGTVTANYEYEPFGQTLRATGSMAKENPFRFSTKRANDTTDLVLYEYRFYSTSAGRWLSRDPAGETGGYNQFGFARNNAIQFLDRLGRDVFSWWPFDERADEFKHWDELSETQKLDWLKRFKKKYEGFINKSAKAHCIPKRLLAVVIMGEMINYSRLEKYLEKVGVGATVGPGQLDPANVGWMFPDVRLSDYHDLEIIEETGHVYRRSAYDQYVNALRWKISSDEDNIEASARRMARNLKESCQDFISGAMTDAWRIIIPSYCKVPEYCCAEKNCDEVFEFKPSKCLVSVMAAAWNDGRIWLEGNQSMYSVPGGFGHFVSQFFTDFINEHW